MSELLLAAEREAVAGASRHLAEKDSSSARRATSPPVRGTWSR